MAILDAANISQYRFKSAGLDEQTFKVVSFNGVEEISQLFQFGLYLVSRDPQIPFENVVDKPATLTMMRAGRPTYIHGLVQHFEQAGKTKEFVVYRAVLTPRLWRLTRYHQSRIFQHASVKDIIIKVLKDAGFKDTDYHFDLKNPPPPREYCVQYDETDLAFISRLMEFEGISYFFKHGSEREQLVMVNHKKGFKNITGKRKIRFQEPTGEVLAVETVRRFICSERIVTGKVVLKDYNYETPEDPLVVEQPVGNNMPGMYYEFGPHYKDTGGGKRLAQVRSEEIECQRRVLTGQSDCVGFRSGGIFTLAYHYRSDFNERYLLTHVKHEGQQQLALGLEGVSEQEALSLGLGTLDENGLSRDVPTYSNTFTCIPASVAYRPPRRTPVPRVSGVMTARMETLRPDDDYAYLDNQGRYHAKMTFDRGPETNGEATKPIRMSQPYSGSIKGTYYGIHFPNHRDTEMLWACINGDIDRPIALGTVPNMTHQSPSTAANKPQNVIRTWALNELTFDDEKKNEEIYMHATKDHRVRVKNNESITVDNDQTIWVKHDRTKTVGNDEKNTIHQNRTTDIEEGDETLTVQTGDRTVTVDKGNDAHTVEQDRSVLVRSGDDFLHVLSGLKFDQIRGPYKIVVEEDRFEIICGHSSLTLYKNGKIEIFGNQIDMVASGPITINGSVVDIN